MIQFIKTIIFISIIFFTNNAFCKEISKNKPNNDKLIILKEPITLPDIGFLDSEAKIRHFEEWNGQVLIVNFWASWCTTCTSEMVELDELQKEYRKRPLKVIAISEDFKGIEAVKEFYKKYNITLLDAYIDQKSKLFKEFEIIGLPTSFIVDDKNQIVARINGRINLHDEKILKLIEKHLKTARMPMVKEEEKEEVSKPSELDTKIEKKEIKEEKKDAVFEFPEGSITYVPEK
jgi:thiol-disulfide isomerase/thioredoxin